MAKNRKPEESRSALIATSESATAGFATAIAMFHPSLAVVAAAGTPFATSKLSQFLMKFQKRRDERISHLLTWVAKFGGVDIDEFLDRSAANPQLEDLLLRTLRATADSSVRGKILSYAMALANASKESAPGEEIEWERMFVRAIDDLDFEHIQLLQRLSLTANELGLGDLSAAFDVPIGTINEVQLRSVTEDLTNLPMLLAVLQRNGLVIFRSVSGGGFSGGSTMNYWELSQFGSDVLKRFDDIDSLLKT